MSLVYPGFYKGGCWIVCLRCVRNFLPPTPFFKLTIPIRQALYSVGEQIVESIIIIIEIVMFSSFNFSWNLSSDVSARCSNHPQGKNGN